MRSTKSFALVAVGALALLLGSENISQAQRGGRGQLERPATITNAIALAAGELHSLAVREDGTVVAWGTNNFGQTNIPSGLSNVIAVAAGSAHNLALKENGTVVAWGTNDLGQTSVPSGLNPP